MVSLFQNFKSFTNYFFHQIDDFGALKQEYYNKMELFRDQYRSKGLVGAKVRFKVRCIDF